MPSACPWPTIAALAGVRLLVPSLFVVAFVLSPWVAQADTITVAVGCSLPQAIRAANTDSPVSLCAPGNGDDIIVLTVPVNPVTYNASFDVDGPNATPSITTTIVISGGVAGAVVERTGADDARLFHVAATGNLTLEKVTVKNGRLAVDNGGAIYNLGTLTLLDSVLLSNTTQSVGGGFFNLGTATLTNTQILSNTAIRGAGFYNLATATLSGSDILSNTALSGNGGGFYSNGTVTLTNTQIVSNSALTGNGGGFFNLGTATLTNAQIVSNRAQNGNGGGFYNDTSATATLTDSGILSNTADNGGGFYNNGTATLTGSDLISNRALAGGGGGFYSDNNATATLTNTQILSNMASFGGGFFNDLNSTATLTSSDILSNSALTGDGGGFYNIGTATLTNTQIVSNTASAGRGGGFFNFGTATLTDSDVRSNKAPTSDGGGFYNGDSATATLTNSDLHSNLAEDGAGFYNSGTTTLTDSEIGANQATDEGGGFANGGTATATLTNTQIVSNTAEDGGGFYNSSTATLTDSDLRSNSAQIGGGFFNDISGTATLSDLELRANNAQSGGGFYNNGTASLTDVAILANMAEDGGGFLNNDSATATLMRTGIHTNTATNFGGGFSNLGTATLTDSGLRANQATNEGGGFSNSGTATLTGGELSSNTADKGGGLYNIGTATLSQVRILENEAASSGGALTQDFFGATTLEQSCIVHNSDTAVVHNSGPTVDADNNWWGAPDGPSGAGLGAGDSVSSGVDFTPFLATAVLGCPLRQAEVAFAKRVSPAGNLMPGQPMSYTLTLTNTGTLAVHNLHLSDALPPLGFVLDSLTAGGAPLRISGNTTIFTTTAPGQVVTVTLSGHVDATLTEDLLLTNTATVTSPVLALLSESVDANVVVPSLNWSSAAYQSDEGSGTVNATLLLTPPNPYATVTVQAVITDSAAALRSVAAVEELTFPPGSDSQTLAIPDVDDQQILTRTVQLGLAAPVGAALGNSSRATLTFADNDEAGLAVSISANVAQADVGDTITYTVRITNTGDVTFTTVNASDDLVGTVTGLAGALAANGMRSATIPYVVQPEDVGALVNTVTVTGMDALGATVVAEDAVSVTVTMTVTPQSKAFLPTLRR